MQSSGNAENIKREQDEIDRIYQQLVTAKETDNADMAQDAVGLLAENYKKMFALDNVRNILLDLAKEYLHKVKHSELTDSQYGEGCSEYIAYAIQKYYGV